MTALHLETRDVADGGVEFLLRGELTLATAQTAWPKVVQRATDLPEGALRRIDLTSVERLDGAGAAALLALRARTSTPARPVELAGARPEALQMLQLYGCPSQHQCLKGEPQQMPILEQVGREVLGLRAGFVEIVDALGQLCVAIARAVRRPGSVAWRDVPQLMERAGADAVPIILLINFLVGFIIALQSADQLRQFGASIFLADLMGISLTRELAGLMTAIIVAGRSGAAYAAELGTMRVNEEIDALRSLGLDPLRQLVLPRVVALTAVVPLLTFLAMVIGALGGMLVAVTSLDLTPTMFATRLQAAIRPLDVVEGLTKSGVFAAAITFISCHRGLTTRGGAAGVGRSTTGAVVTILFHLIALDAVMSTLFNLLR
ncbi:MAG: ABC transporter permease [Planctomycetes bacterium]|nr:ABC transporter permease [Planctomycetota bacterium]